MHAAPANRFATLPQMQFPEAAVTFSRPFGHTEFTYLKKRRGRGYVDCFTILTLECSGQHCISNDEVVMACAALRLRHPLFASKVSFVTSEPRLVYTAPFPEEHAIKEARCQITFCTFSDQDEAADLCQRWLGGDSREVLDLRDGTCAVRWSTHANPSQPRYVFGLLTAHFIADGRRRLNLARLFMELLTTPGRARAELVAYFTGEVPIVAMPGPLEGLIPDIGAYDADEMVKAKQAFADLMKTSAMPMTGLVPDGKPQEDKPVGRLVRHAWSREDTATILRTCKAHGVTITHLTCATMALATVRNPDGGMEEYRTSTPPADDVYYFNIVQAVDLLAKAKHGSSMGESETALRMQLYPVFLCVLRKALDRSEGLYALWGIAKQFKAGHAAYVDSPYFWQFIRQYSQIMSQTFLSGATDRPFLPYMSSLGDCEKLLPARYPIDASGNTGNIDGAPTSGGELRITEMTTAGKVDPLSATPTFLLWTFDGRLHMQLKHNVSCTSPGLIDPYFSRIVEMITKLAVDGEGMH